MKSLKMFSAITLISFLSSTNYTYSLTWSWSSDSSSSVFVNGKYYSCNGSATMINDKVYCNGVLISGNGNHIKDAGEIETKTIHLENFTEFNISNIGKLTIEHCPTCEEQLTMTADKNIMPYLKTDISNGTLKIGVSENSNISTNTPIEFYAVVKSLTKISGSGNTNITTKGFIKGNRLDIKASGNTSVDAFIDANNLAVNLSGNSSATVRGIVNEQTVDLSGNAKYVAENLNCNITTANASANSKMYASVRNRLKVKASGNANIIYWGSPAKDINTSGNAKVTNKHYTTR